MTTGSLDLVRELRERTGAGIMDCKAALQASGNDLEKAIDYIRKKGVAATAKRAGREAREGFVAARVEGKKAVIVEVNCETDFVARTDDFKSLVALAMSESLAKGEAAVKSDAVSAKVAELAGKIGEKIEARRAKVVESPSGALFVYMHSNNKLGVIVELGFAKAETAKNPLLEELGKNLAMQVAASNPLCLTRKEVPADALEREKAIFREEVKGKPDNIVEKIVEGKLSKFYQTNCLIEQPYIKDDKTSVQALVADAAKKLSDGVEVKRFVRFQLGESTGS